MSPRTLSFTIVGLLILCIGSPLLAANTSGTLFFTRFDGTNRVLSAPYSFDGTTFSIGSQTLLATQTQLGGGADGIALAPNGNFLIGGQGNAVHQMNQAGTSFQSITAGGGSSFLITVDPSGNKAWTSGLQSTTLTSVPLTPNFGPAVPHTLSGDDKNISDVAFVGSTAYYANGAVSGGGNFGTIDLNTFKTTRILSNVPAARGLWTDPFTGDIIMFGDNHISQFDPKTNQIVSTLTTTGQNFDRGSTDSSGHLFAVSNTGNIWFIDYSATGLIGSGSNFVQSTFVDSKIDDVITMTGVVPPTPPGAVPEPITMAAFGIAAAVAGWTGSRRMKRVPVVA